MKKDILILAAAKRTLLLLLTLTLLLSGTACRSQQPQTSPSPSPAASPQASPEQSAVLERFGYLLGRFVYLCDALDDLEDDRRRRRYNPFLYAEGEAVSAAKNALFLTTAELCDDFDLLVLHRYEGILENIVRIGLRAEVLRIEKKLKGGDKHGTEPV